MKKHTRFFKEAIEIGKGLGKTSFPQTYPISPELAKLCKALYTVAPTLVTKANDMGTPEEAEYFEPAIFDGKSKPANFLRIEVNSNSATTKLLKGECYFQVFEKALVLTFTNIKGSFHLKDQFKIKKIRTSGRRLHLSIMEKSAIIEITAEFMAG